MILDQLLAVAHIRTPKKDPGVIHTDRIQGKRALPDCCFSCCEIGLCQEKFHGPVIQQEGIAVDVLGFRHHQRSWALQHGL